MERKKNKKNSRKQTIKVLLFYNTAEAAAVAATLKVLCLRAIEDKKGPDWMLLPSLCIMSPRSFNTPLTYHSPALSLFTTFVWLATTAVTFLFLAAIIRLQNSLALSVPL